MSKVKLLAHTQLSAPFRAEVNEILDKYSLTDGQVSTLTAIRTCYSHYKPTEILIQEGDKYFGNRATDDRGGTEADRLFRLITGSGHTSTLETISFTFAIEGVSRALLAQLTRHRIGFSFSVQSQRYVRFGSDDKSEGFDYVTPDSIADKDAEDIFSFAMEESQALYNALRKKGVPPEDARMVLPNAATCNLVMTCNLTSLIGLYGKRRKGNGAQSEIAELVEQLKDAVIEIEPFVAKFFEGGGK